MELKLSEAIRIGATKRPQMCLGFYFNQGRSCALGAAYEGVTSEYNEDIGFFDITEFFPQLHEMVDNTPLYNHVIGQNDALMIPREEIADWLETKGY